MNHFTTKAGYDSIRSQPTWVFRATKPPGDHPRGAYFTTLDRDRADLARRLRIPREKVGYFFSFTGDAGLRPLPGSRGQYIFYSPEDYRVRSDRQIEHGSTGVA